MALLCSCFGALNGAKRRRGSGGYVPRWINLRSELRKWLLFFCATAQKNKSWRHHGNQLLDVY